MERLKRLDHLRFVAAALVVYWHYSNAVQPNVPSIFGLFFQGHTGVAMFCVISGFLFMTLYLDKDLNVRDFALARALRILPLFILTVVVAWNMAPTPIGDLLAGVLSTLSGHGLPSLAAPGWTILVEIQFYILFPFLLIFFRKYGTIYLLGLFAMFVGLKFLIWYGNGSVSSMAYISIIGRIDQFLAGMIAAVILKRSGISNKLIFTNGVVGIVVIIAIYAKFFTRGGFYGPSSSTSYLWAFLPAIEGVSYAAILVAYLRLPAATNVAARYTGAVLAWGGLVSYSIYLTHLMTLPTARYMAAKVFNSGTGTSQAAAFIVVLILVVLVSSATYIMIEKPFKDLRKDKKPPPPSTPSAKLYPAPAEPRELANAQ